MSQPTIESASMTRTIFAKDTDVDLLREEEKKVFSLFQATHGELVAMANEAICHNLKKPEEVMISCICFKGGEVREKIEARAKGEEIDHIKEQNGFPAQIGIKKMSQAKELLKDTDFPLFLDILDPPDGHVWGVVMCDYGMSLCFVPYQVQD